MMSGRIGLAGEYLELLYRRNRAEGMSKPQAVDTIYLAGQGILSRALRHEVDWVLLVSGTYIHPEILVLLQRAGLRVAALLTETPYADAQEKLIAERVQVVWTNERTSIPFFEQYCDHVYYWQHALDLERHTPASNGEIVLAHDVVFVGTGFIERQEFLHGINWEGIDFGLYGGWDLMGSRNRLRKHLVAPIVSNELTAELYRRAKVGINLHRLSIGWGREVSYIEKAESLNPRCYELAACGCFFICDRRAEVADVFGDLVPTFDTPEEAEDLIRYYLAHEDERRRIAEALPETVKNHTFDSRLIEMLEVLENGTL